MKGFFLAIVASMAMCVSGAPSFFGDVGLGAMVDAGVSAEKTVEGAVGGKSGEAGDAAGGFFKELNVGLDAGVNLVLGGGKKVAGEISDEGKKATSSTSNDSASNTKDSDKKNDSGSSDDVTKSGKSAIDSGKESLGALGDVSSIGEKTVSKGKKAVAW